MIGRAIGLSHSEDCDNADWDWLCDECRAGVQQSDAMACHADRDGDCAWDGCPQLRDGEPAATGRHCPLDVRSEES